MTFYTFQGLSADGAWYVAAFFPVRVPFAIPPYTPPEPADEAAYAATCDAANAALAAALEDLPGGAFIPSLGLLDALVASLRTDLPGGAGLATARPGSAAGRLK